MGLRPPEARRRRRPRRGALPVLVVAAVVAASLGACGGDDSPAPGAGNTFSSREHGFAITGPRGWTKGEAAPALVVFRSPQADESDAFTENVNVTVEDLPSDSVSLRQYRDGALANVRRAITNFRLLEEGDARLGGTAAARISYLGTQGQFQLRFLQVFAVRTAKAYVVTFTAEEPRFEQYRPAAQTAIDSFTFT